MSAGGDEYAMAALHLSTKIQQEGIDFARSGGGISDPAGIFKAIKKTIDIVAGGDIAEGNRRMAGIFDAFGINIQESAEEFRTLMRAKYANDPIKLQEMDKIADAAESMTRGFFNQLFIHFKRIFPLRIFLMVGHSKIEDVAFSQ